MNVSLSIVLLDGESFFTAANHMAVLGTYIGEAARSAEMHKGADDETISLEGSAVIGGHMTSIRIRKLEDIKLGEE